ncbi:hypothetical protein BH23ACT9_BH23ACT9_15880 [soil metagenome]
MEIPLGVTVGYYVGSQSGIDATARLQAVA